MESFRDDFLSAGCLGLARLATAAILTPIAATPALAQCAVTGGPGAMPWSTCGTWSGPSWPNEGTIYNGQPGAAPVLASVDFNGDGKSDLVYQGLFDYGLSTSLSTGTGFTTATAPATPQPAGCYTGNFDGSGRAGIACGNSTDIAFASSTGTGFSSFTTVTTNGLWGMNVGSPAAGISGNPCFVMDVDGDGTDDIVCGSPASISGTVTYPSSTSWGVYLSTGGTFKYETWTGPAGGFTQTTGCVVGDFNGDGLKDLACQWSGVTGTKWAMLISTGRGWSNQTWTGPSSGNTLNCTDTQGNPAACLNLGSTCLVGDYNGDGIDDIACALGNNQWSIGFGGGSSGSTSTFKSTATWTVPVGTVSSTYCPASYYCGCIPVDMYGTGFTGLLCATNLTSSATGWAYLASNGSSFTATTFSTSWSLLTNGTGGWGLYQGGVQQLCVFADFNGDGIKDVACNPTGVSNNGTWFMGLSSRPQ